ncbi:MAG: alcohol dehydrogenase catalytic domain-containing protein [Myxococcales bacterium]|nr:alcohol dehydrogenase catalytic domain-containing protein [Myxococcales bacterium]
MLALRFDGRRARVSDVPEPEATPGFAIVDVRLAGVCDTDLQIAKGYMGFRGVLGHELVGVVAEGPDAWRGRRVACEINFACGAPGCDACARGLGRHCPTRRVMGILDADGAFARRVAVPVANLHAVPDAVDDARAVFTEPLAAAFEILEQVEVAPGARAVVLGDGKLGVLVAQVLANAGARVLAVGHHRAKLDALARRGIETALASDFAAGVDAAPASRADLVVDATGSPSALELAVRATRPRGTLVLKTTTAERPSLDFARVVVDEIRIVGSRCGPFAPALEALASGAVDVASLLDDRFPLEHADAALERAAERGARKVLIECGGA